MLANFTGCDRKKVLSAESDPVPAKIENISVNEKKLFELAEKGETKLLMDLKSKGVDICQSKEKGYPPLFAAIDSDKTETVDFLISTGCDASREDYHKAYKKEFGKDLIDNIISKKQKKMVEMLLQKQSGNSIRKDSIMCQSIDENNAELFNIFYKSGMNPFDVYCDHVNILEYEKRKGGKFVSEIKNKIWNEIYKYPENSLVLAIYDSWPIASYVNGKWVNNWLPANSEKEEIIEFKQYLEKEKASGKLKSLEKWNVFEDQKLTGTYNLKIIDTDNFEEITTPGYFTLVLDRPPKPEIESPESDSNTLKWPYRQKPAASFNMIPEIIPFVLIKSTDSQYNKLKDIVFSKATVFKSSKQILELKELKGTDLIYFGLIREKQTTEDEPKYYNFHGWINKNKMSMVLGNESRSYGDSEEEKIVDMGYEFFGEPAIAFKHDNRTFILSVYYGYEWQTYYIHEIRNNYPVQLLEISGPGL